MERNLDGIDLLGELSQSDRRELESKCKWRECAPDEIILSQDDESVDVYFIVAGTVRAITGTGDGQEVVLADLKVGSFFGEVSAIDNRGRSARIISREPTVIAVLGRDDFRAMLVAHPKVALKLLEHLAGIVRTTNVRVSDILERTPSQRVYGELLRMAEPNPSGDGSWIISTVPAHNELAAWATTDRATVASAIGGLVREGVVRRKDRSYLIGDYAKLRTLTEL